VGPCLVHSDRCRLTEVRFRARTERNRRLKILISAYACEPHQGSEPAVGWNWSLQAARHGHEVHVVTRANNRQVIEAELADNPVPGLHFHYLDLPAPFLRFKERSGFYGMLIYYYLWQIALGLEARRLHKAVGFDMSHHVTFCNDWMPSGLCFLRIPFIWGPVGGSTHRIPKQLDLGLPGYARRHEQVRRFTQTLAKRADPFVWVTRRRANIILAFTDQARFGIPRAQRDKTETVVHIGVASEDISPPSPRHLDQQSNLLVLTGGRLVHWKGLDLLIEGLADHVRRTGADTRLLITGKGEYRAHLETRARDMGVTSQIDFMGRLPGRDDVCELLHRCHLYALPTLRDGPPVAILEAMALGLPILCLDYGATRELVPDEAGIKILPESREQIVESIGAALTWADTHRSSLEEMGAAARRHVLKVHRWDQIGDRIETIYELVGRDALRRNSVR
jgi:glycosyltransferase involved in cell wall biosynthesis